MKKVPPFQIGSAAAPRRIAGYSAPGFYPKLDVHGMRISEAMPKVEAWLDSALVGNFSTLKILHGKGTGALRQEIRRYLKTLPFVERYYDENPDFGGAGITVVEISIH